MVDSREVLGGLALRFSVRGFGVLMGVAAVLFGLRGVLLCGLVISGLVMDGGQMVVLTGLGVMLRGIDVVLG
jgi:hypothetical protein